jgi:hypothetical protein
MRGERQIRLTSRDGRGYINRLAVTEMISMDSGVSDDADAAAFDGRGISRLTNHGGRRPREFFPAAIQTERTVK